MEINNKKLYRKIILHSLLLRIRRISVVFLALMTGSAIITAMASVYFDINIKMSQELRTFGANLFLGPNNDQQLTDQEYIDSLKLAPTNSIVASSPYLYGLARIDLDKVVLMGVDFSQLQALSPFWQIKGEWINVSFDENHAMVGEKLAKKLGLKLNQTINLIKDKEKHPIVIKGIVETGDATDNYLILNLSLVQKWLNKNNNIDYVMYSVLNDKYQVNDFTDRLNKKMPNKIIRPILKVSDSEGKVLDKVKILMGVVSIVILILSTLCVNTTLTAMVSERRKEFALQKSLGASNKSIMNQIIIETSIIAILALIVGIILGFGLAQILGHTVFDSSISFRYQVLPITILSSLIAGFIAVILPTMKAMSYQPARVLKGE